MKHKLLDIVSNRQINNDNIDPFKIGSIVKVFLTISDGSSDNNDQKKRTQVFDGLVIAFHGEGSNKTFTVRKIFENVGIERTFSLYSPLIQKIELVKNLKVRRAKLYYMRNRNYKNSINKV